jgi:hypothetical protein
MPPDPTHSTCKYSTVVITECLWIMDPPFRDSAAVRSFWTCRSVPSVVGYRAQVGWADAIKALGGSAVVGSFVAVLGDVAGEARTRGFAAPAFAGCASVEVWGYATD